MSTRRTNLTESAGPPETDKASRAGDVPITVTPEDDAQIARYVRIGNQPTTFRLEAPTWNALCKIARAQGITVDQLCADIAEVTAPDAAFAVAVRAYVVGHFCDQMPQDLLPDELGSFCRGGYRNRVN